ncbi:hypothetical protein Tco_1174741 [Tanacetum coccineum]
MLVEVGKFTFPMDIVILEIEEDSKVPLILGGPFLHTTNAQGNSQVQDNKIDLLVQQYEQFSILEEESIDSGFARFNTIITSLKALDESFFSKNYVKKFLRDLHFKQREKVTSIEESKDLSSLALYELISNLKQHEVVVEKDFEIYRGKKERLKSIVLKAKKESSDDETSTSGNDDEEYVMVVRNFKKFFRRKGKFVRQQREEKSHSDKGMRRKERVIRNALDAVIQIISLAIVQNLLTTQIKSPLLEVLGAIVKMKSRTKLTMKLVSSLNRQMRYLIVPFQVFSIWKAFGRNSRDLGSFGEETDKTTDLHQHLSRISTQKLETASQITRDAVTTHLKTASQDLKMVSECTT